MTAQVLAREGSLLTQQDLYLFNEGNHLQLYDKLGAQVRTVRGVKGVNFAVWAPSAVPSRAAECCNR